MDIQQGIHGLRELALFAGAGGGILGGKLLGWRTVCAVERDAYPAQVLAQRQNDGVLPPFPIWSDVESFDGKPWKGIVDVVSGGFPCQDISVAGGGDGIEGKKSGMWRHAKRIIREVEPEIVYLENSPALTSRGLGRVLGDMAELGFDAEWGVLGARHLLAPHDRDRIWILARKIPDSYRMRKLQQERVEQEQRGWAGNVRSEVSNTDSFGLSRLEPWTQQGAYGRPHRLHDRERSSRKWAAWPPEPNVGRVADGVAHRVDRVKAVGNGQVSIVAATAFRLLAARAGIG